MHWPVGVRREELKSTKILKIRIGVDPSPEGKN
jgi:hypothetical protein